MCTNILVCHGDKLDTLKKVYNDLQAKKIGEADCAPATFYITKDGQYAIDADFVSVADINDPEFDLTNVPKIKLSRRA